MAATTIAPTNKAVAFRAKPQRERANAVKKVGTRKRANKAIARGLVSAKAAVRHLKDI